jgi:predicted TIM-barrel fold metal-dependent hydrolase
MGQWKHSVIDCDGHLIESMSELTEFMDKEMRAAVLNGDRNREGVFPSLDGFHGPRIPRNGPDASLTTRPYVTASDERKGSGPDYLAFVEKADVEQAVMFTSEGLSVGFIQSADYAARLCRAYNDYVYDRYRRLSDRLHPMALIPLQDPEAARLELRRVVRDLGFIGAMLPSAGKQLHLGHQYYWPIYREAAELGAALGVHGGSAADIGIDSFTSFRAMYGLHHSIPLLTALASFIGHGVLEEFSDLRVGFFEGGCAWVVCLLDRMERNEDVIGTKAPRHLEEYLAEDRVLIGCEGNDGSLPDLIRRVGTKGFAWASDYPHEVDLVAAKHMIEETEASTALSEEAKAAILGENSRNFFRIDARVPA